MKRANSILAFALMLAMPAAAAAQDRSPFQQGTVGIEFGAAPLIETWNLNGHREPMLEVNASFWGGLTDRFALGLEFHHGFVWQHTPGAFVQGVSSVLRWRIADQPNWDWFLEAGPGVSWSDLSTPPNGTKFNYLFQAGAGGMRQIGTNQSLVLAYRFLHLSNSRREGRERNPDLEMMGVYAGWSFSF